MNYVFCSFSCCVQTSKACIHYLICNSIHEHFKSWDLGKMLKASDQNWIILTIRHHHTFILSIIHFVDWRKLHL